MITEQLATCSFDGGPGAYIYFALPQDQGLAVDAWIDLETGGLVVDVERLTFTGGIEICIDTGADLPEPARFPGRLARPIRTDGHISDSSLSRWHARAG